MKLNLLCYLDAQMMLLNNYYGCRQNMIVLHSTLRKRVKVAEQLVD